MRLKPGLFAKCATRAKTKRAKLLIIFLNAWKRKAMVTPSPPRGFYGDLAGLIMKKRTANAEPIQPAKNEQIKRVLSKIKNDYSRPLTLSELAETARLNPQYLCRAFRQVTGKTPIDYLNYYRIECAAEKLCYTNLSVTEIALSCGFNDLSYFNRLFKRHKNASPSAFRKRYNSIKN